MQYRFKLAYIHREEINQQHFCPLLPTSCLMRGGFIQIINHKSCRVHFETIILIMTHIGSDVHISMLDAFKTASLAMHHISITQKFLSHAHSNQGSLIMCRIFKLFVLHMLSSSPIIVLYCLSTYPSCCD